MRRDVQIIDAIEAALAGRGCPVRVVRAQSFLRLLIPGPVDVLVIEDLVRMTGVDDIRRTSVAETTGSGRRIMTVLEIPIDGSNLTK